MGVLDGRSPSNTPNLPLTPVIPKEPELFLP